MPKRKRVLALCHGPIALSKAHDTPWEDVWVRFTQPGTRQIIQKGPCLCSRDDVARDIPYYERRVAETRGLRKANYQSELDETRALLARIDAEEVVIVRDKMYDNGIPNIYTKVARITRPEAERMLAVYLADFGVKNPKFKWPRPKFWATPV